MAPTISIQGLTHETQRPKAGKRALAPVPPTTPPARRGGGHLPSSFNEKRKIRNHDEYQSIRAKAFHVRLRASIVVFIHHVDVESAHHEDVRP